MYGVYHSGTAVWGKASVFFYDVLFFTFGKKFATASLHVQGSGFCFLNLF